MTDTTEIARIVAGQLLNAHCPFDETRLRASKVPGGLEAKCPVCWTYFPETIPHLEKQG